MSDSPVAELTLALLGDPASFERMMTAAEARLDKFVTAVDAKGAKLQASLDRTLGVVGTSAGKLDAALEPVAAAFDNVASSASVAGEHIRAATGDLRDVTGEARRAGSALGELEQRGQSAGKSVAEGMARSRDGATGAAKALGGFLETINRVRAAASKPIVQKVTVKQEGGGGGKRQGGGGGHALDGYAMMAAGGGILSAEGDMIKQGEAVEDELRKLYATAGETQNYETLRREVLGIATQFGLMPVEVAKALYPIESLGYKGANGLKVLTASARMAKGSQADLRDVSELISKTLNAYGLGAEHAGHLTDVFTVAIKDAVVPGREFVPAYSSVMTIAKNAGLSVEETAGALAVMTHNAKSASVGATQLRAFISGIITPTKAMRDAAKQAGLAWLASGEGAAEFKRVGFAGVLDEIRTATDGNVTALGKLLPDMRKNQAAMALLNNGGVVFARTLKDVQDSQGATAKSAQEMDKSLGQSARNMDAAFGAASSNLEDALKPVLTKVYGLATSLINAFNRLPASSQKTIGVVTGVTGAALLLAGAVLTVSRWVTGMAPVFAKFSAQGSAANTTVAASAGEAAAAEANIGPAGEASAEQLRAAATGMLTANEEIEASAGAAATAEAGIGTAATEAAAGGVAAFAVGAAWFVAISAAVALVGLLAYKWWQVEQAQNDAAKAQQKFNDVASAMQSQGGQAAMIGTRAKVLSESTDLTDAITTANNDPVNITKFQKDMEVREQLKAKGYDTSNHAYNSVDGAQARIKALDASAAQLLTAINQAHKDGVNAGTKSAHSDGANGFALAVANVDPQSIITDKVGNTCANFVSKVFQKAGLQIDTINRAKDLRDKILQMGGQVHGGAALPGDLIVYHGGRFGTKAGGGYHVGYGVGDGTDWESSRGKTKRKNIAGNLKWGGPGATVEFITVPGSTFSHPPPDAEPSSSGGAEPDWAKHLGDKKKKAHKPSVGGSLQDISLHPLADVLPVGDLNGAATNAGNYEEKLQRLDDALAAHDLKMAESGKSYDTYAVKTAALVQKLALSDNAIRNTQGKINTLAPKVSSDETGLKASTAEFNQLAEKIKAQKQSGQTLSPSEVAEYNRRRATYAAAKAAYDADNTQLKENQRVHHQAVQNKIADLQELQRVHEEQQRKESERFLKQQGQAVKLGPDTGGISRDAYDQSLKDALSGKNKSIGTLNPEGDEYARISDALTQSQIARQQAGAKVSRETLQLQKKDFDALQDDLNDEVQAYRDAGVAETDIATWRNLKQHEMDMARSKQSRDDALGMAREMTSLGMETQVQLQQQMGQAIVSLQRDMATAQTPAETQAFALQIAKLRLEVSKIDWEAASKQAEGWKQAVDTGKLSTEEYILRLRDLQAQIPSTAEEYQRLTSEIDAANKAMYDKAEQQAGATASKATDQIMAVMQKAKTLKAAIRDSFKEAATDAVHKTIEDAIKKQVLRVLVQSDADKMKKAAEQHEKATNLLGVHVARLSDGVDKFGGYVGQFVAAVQQMASQPAGGAAGTAAPDTTTAGASTKPSGSVKPSQSAEGGGSSFGGPSAAGALATVAGATADLRQKGSVAGDTALINDASSLTGDKSSNALTSGLGGVQSAAGMASSIASVSKWAQLSQGIGQVMPYVGLALAVASLFGPKKAATPTSLQTQQYANVLTTFSGTIDSGYSGSDGLRTLLGPTTRQAAGVSTAGQAGQPPQFNINIAAGAFQGIADPQGHANVILDHIQTGLSRMNALDNASRGAGG